jgi:hypothetical protein
LPFTFSFHPRIHVNYRQLTDFLIRLSKHCPVFSNKRQIITHCCSSVAGNDQQ